jgi:hypothetical protein
VEDLNSSKQNTAKSELNSTHGKVHESIKSLHKPKNTIFNDGHEQREGKLSIVISRVDHLSMDFG